MPTRAALSGRGCTLVDHLVERSSLDFHPGRRFALWHDRAVLHFSTELDERDDCRASLERCLRPAGYVVVATFGPDGPTTCSGLPIVRLHWMPRGLPRRG